MPFLVTNIVTPDETDADPAFLVILPWLNEHSTLDSTLLSHRRVKTNIESYQKRQIFKISLKLLEYHKEREQFYQSIKNVIGELLNTKHTKFYIKSLNKSLETQIIRDFEQFKNFIALYISRD